MTVLQTQIEARQKRFMFLALLLLGAVLYIGLATRNYDGNDINELSAIEQGGAALISPNHLLYRPVVRVTYDLMRAFGYTGLATLPAQLVNGIAGLLGLALFYLWMTRLVASNTIAAAAALGFGTSWSYWIYSSNAIYIIPATTSVLAGLVLLTWIYDRPHTQVPASILMGIGVMGALGTLFWQANIFFAPVILLALFAYYRPHWATFLRASIIFLVTMGGLVAAVYLAGSLVILQNEWNAPGVIGWIMGYSGVRLPGWGAFDFARFGYAAHSIGSNILPIWEGPGLRELLRGHLQSDKLLIQLSLVALFLIVAIPLVKQVLNRSFFQGKRQLILLLLIGYTIYLPFVIWWDPFEPRWFIIPSIALWTIFGIFWDSLGTRVRYAWAFSGLVLIITLANFTATIWPRYASPNTQWMTAACVTQHLDEEDIFLSVEWGWPDYLPYFFDREVFFLISEAGRAGSSDALLEDLQKYIDVVDQRGGEVYMVDPDSISPDHITWLGAQTGIKPEDFQRLEVSAPIFTCDEVDFRVLSAINRNAQG